ncbi:MAG: SPOR domain-containing protein [Burkholderiales bacterium]|nr:SPOR domain-containing protein [Burkholderiales bacterium]
MARDHRPRQSGRRGGGLLLGVFVGFLLGVGSSAAVAVFFFKTPVPFLQRQKPPETPAATGQNLKDAPPAAQANDGKPRFDFYRILPGQEEAVTSEQLKQATVKDKEAAGKTGEAESGETYFLQAGAFQNPADADNLKARLALLGLESGVEPIAIPDKGVWYRVRLGPYRRIDDLNNARSQLAQNGIDASLVKVRSTASP